METIRVGIIGAGGIAPSHIRGYAGNTGVEIAAVCDIVSRRAERLVNQYRLESADIYEDYRQILERSDIDAVSICTPNNLHHPMVMDALAAGKHVLCEKPLAMSVYEAKAMTETAREQRLVGMTGFTYHYIPSFQFALNLVKNGEFGDIHRIKADYTMGIYSREAKDIPIHWRLLKAQSGGGVTGDLAAHILHLGRMLFSEAKTVTADLKQLLPASEEISQSSILIEYTNGAVGNYEASWHAPGRNNFQRLEVSGSKGAFIYEFWKPSHLDIYSWEGLGRHNGDFVTVEVPGAPNFRQDLIGRSWNNIAHDWAMVQEIACFLRCIRDNTPEKACPSFYDGLKVQEIVEAARVSSEEGKRIRLDE